MPEEMRIWVGEQKQTSSAQAGQLVKDYLQARKLTQATGKVDPPKRWTSELQLDNVALPVANWATSSEIARKEPRQGAAPLLERSQTNLTGMVFAVTTAGDGGT